jgi:hypothetical protein
MVACLNPDEAVGCWPGSFVEGFARTTMDNSGVADALHMLVRKPTMLQRHPMLGSCSAEIDFGGNYLCSALNVLPLHWCPAAEPSCGPA